MLKLRLKSRDQLFCILRKNLPLISTKQATNGAAIARRTRPGYVPE
jgi:hypothetical protein